MVLEEEVDCMGGPESAPGKPESASAVFRLLGGALVLLGVFRLRVCLVVSPLRDSTMSENLDIFSARSFLAVCIPLVTVL